MDQNVVGEIRLLQASIKGSSEAFEGLVRKYQSLVCAITYSATGDIEKSEELAQETFVRAWKNLKQLRDQSRFKFWLCSIAKSTIKNYFRNRKRDIIHKAGVISDAADIPSATPDPSHNLIAKEQQTVVDHALQEIPESYRQPLVLFYRQEQSVSQVAEQLELTEETVRTRLSRGRKMLKQKVTAMVENTLSSTAPGKAFTIAVMASVAGLALKGTAAAAAATTAPAAATGTGITAILSTITAKIVTAAAVLAIGVGAVITYKMMKNTDAPTPPIAQAPLATQHDQPGSTSPPDRNTNGDRTAAVGQRVEP
jgi:RNA polymerase sigma factor (sigma-70 family)